MIKILFLIHDLGEGGAEKVLVNLVNNMDAKQFDITVMTLFDVGVNKQFLNPNIAYRTCFSTVFPGNSHIMKLLSPKRLHRMFIKDMYDIEVAYLEGPCARVISGCPNKQTKLVSWIHCTMSSPQMVAASFRSVREATLCYNRMDRMVFVSESVGEAFLKHCTYTGETAVLYNTNESERILEKASKPLDRIFDDATINLVGVGKLTPNKGFDRLLKIVKRLRDEQYAVCLYILGIGPMQSELEQYISENELNQYAVLLGYQTNPYPYVANSDMYICSSYSEGFSTAATEALIVGTPVCTVDVSGMKEMLGENNEYGVVVENDDEALYRGIKGLLDDPALLAHYKRQAIKRGKDFSTEKTVQAVEDMLVE